jgi:hypothetical protein
VHALARPFYGFALNGFNAVIAAARICGKWLREVCDSAFRA